VAGTVIGRRLVGPEDSWTADQLDHHLARGAMTLRKPNADLVRLAIGELGCPAEAVVMVGDQYLTDVAGANLAGVRSVKLPNPAPRSFPWSIRFTQHLEKLLFRLRPRAQPPSSPGRTPDASS
jgi:predicted HAD superfamily phosphohydrolase YqeG